MTNAPSLFQVLALLVPALSAWRVQAADLNVGPQARFRSIGEALSAAEVGDRIRVSPGAYPETIVWPNTQGLVLWAEQGPDQTAIIGNGRDPVIHMEGKLKWDTRIEGFSIRGGGAGNAPGRFGAGLNIVGASPTVRNCRISGNQARPYRGTGGIFLRDSRAIVEHNEIIGNRYQSEKLHAGGICVWGGMPKIRFNCIEDNKGDDERYFTRGAGIRLSGSKAVVEGNRVRSNVSTSVGSALYAEQGDRSAVFGNEFSGNRNIGGTAGAVAVAPNAHTQVGGMHSGEANAIHGNIHIWSQAVVKEERVANLNLKWLGQDGRSIHKNWWGKGDSKAAAAQFEEWTAKPEAAQEPVDVSQAGLQVRK